MRKLEHGGDIYSRVVTYDFSANINPLGMPQGVKNALINHIDNFERYPDINCTALVNAISEYENVAAEKVLCGNGAADLIYHIVHTLKPRKALLPAPTFSEYENALVSIGCKVEYHMLNESDNFILNNDILDKLCDIDIVFLCSPNNPTGTIINKEVLTRVIKRCQEKNIYIVLDECFMDFVSSNENYSIKPTQENVIILKAFTKTFAMAGLRLGYMLCADISLVERIQGCGQCWSVSVPAQIAGTAALKEKLYIDKSVQLISNERYYLMNALKSFGFKVYLADANFILFRCGIDLDQMLMKEQIAVRNCENYIGLEYGYFRIAVRTHMENEVLIKAIERILNNG